MSPTEARGATAVIVSESVILSRGVKGSRRGGRKIKGSAMERKGVAGELKNPRRHDLEKSGRRAGGGGRESRAYISKLPPGRRKLAWKADGRRLTGRTCGFPHMSLLGRARVLTRGARTVEACPGGGEGWVGIGRCDNTSVHSNIVRNAMDPG